jgi:mRNA-degrading endonuclease toxin of MazEF toxin-antitoxin module
MAGKLRPALIVSASRFNGGDDFVAVPISSQPKADDPYSFPIRDSDAYFADTGLKYNSAVKWTKPQAISKTVVARRLGQVPELVLNQILSLVRSVFS